MTSDHAQKESLGMDIEKIYYCESKVTDDGKKYVACVEEFFPDGVEGSMLSYSYTAEGADRPVIFAYNGGPGSDSTLLHMGLLGPKVVSFPGYPDKAEPGTARIISNDSFLIDAADVVLIDPVGTSWTIAPETDEGKAGIYSIYNDAKSFACFIRDWLERKNRKGAPVYLLGESYGTLRNVAVADILAGELDIKGIISIGNSFNVGSKVPMYVEPNVRRLGANAAACWYHFHREYKERDAFIEEAIDFAYNDYATALLKGNKLTDDEFDAVLDKLSYYSGLGKDLLRNNKLRFSELDFLTQLRNREVISMIDARLYRSYRDGNDETDFMTLEPVDPFVRFIGNTLTDSFKSYMKDELMVPEREYHQDIFSISSCWNYRDLEGDTMLLPVTLMEKIEGLRFLFISGLYDMQSTFDFVRYYLSRYDMPEDRITVREYDAGHASYIGGSCQTEMSADIRAFVGGEI